MAVIVTKEIKKKRILMGVFFVLVLSSGLVLYFGFLHKGSPPPAVVAPVTPAAGVAATSQVSDLKVKILEDDRFKNLELPPGVPIKTETTGKSNPFSD
ncbi:MAG: hypothetical protein AAB725_01425 [Patescibacteria group bacterium]